MDKPCKGARQAVILSHMGEKKFTVLDLISLKSRPFDALHLRCVAGRRGLPRPIVLPVVNRPALALAGYFETFISERIQLFGQGEVGYLRTIKETGDYTNIRRLFTFEMPCCIFSHDNEVDETFLQFAEEAACPVLKTPLTSSEFTARAIRLLSDIFAPKKTLHGVLVEVYGIGILLMGHSGVGKSETALELIERGHRLVADDIVEVRCLNGNIIVGRGASAVISHHMEIRGLGIINIAELYGVGAVREQKEVQLVVQLEEWDQNKVYDRLGLNQVYMKILGVEISTIDIPVRPGRNLPIIIEAAAMNERLKKMGHNSARNFNRNVLKWIEMGHVERENYNNDDSY